MCVHVSVDICTRELWTWIGLCVLGFQDVCPVWASCLVPLFVPAFVRVHIRVLEGQHSPALM